MARDYVLEPFRTPLELRIDYAKELNPQQLEAVTAPPGPALVLAGAGSGKTRTLTYRVAFLLEQGIPPERLLLLTFTNKAAREMMGRVTELLGQELPDLWGGTFHSIGNRVLRRQAHLLGYPRNFGILDRDDAVQLITACVGDSDIDTRAMVFPKPDMLGDIFSVAVNTQADILEVIHRDYGQFNHLGRQISELQTAYSERKKRTGVLDFDDLLALWLKLLREQREVLEYYQDRFQFILVDEYQDTNKLQSEIIDTLAARHSNVMVVGDDAQSIYAWRGANFLNILEFPKRYPGARIYKIETNYRSTPEILTVANAAIQGNSRQFAKELAPARKSGIKPALVVCQSASQQAAFVGQRIMELHEEGASLNSMAVLYRSHFHALELQLELTRRGIPFSITSGLRYFEQAHIKDVAAYLRLVSNPRDEVSFKRIAQLFPGIGAKAAAKLWTAYSPHAPSGAEPPDTEAASVKTKHLATALQAVMPTVPRKAAVSWAQFVATMAQLEQPEVRRKPGKMVQLVLEAGYADYLRDAYTNYGSRREDLQGLAAFAGQFGSAEEFLTQVSLLTTIEAESDRTAAKTDDGVRLSTIHQAKGLEFDIVFLIMLCDGLFPSSRSLENPDSIEEERRLLYVAITRARNELYLTYPCIRMGYGGSGETPQNPSRFLGELGNDLLEVLNLKAPRGSYW